jgi:hypothetical protein
VAVRPFDAASVRRFTDEAPPLSRKIPCSDEGPMIVRVVGAAPPLAGPGSRHEAHLHAAMAGVGTLRGRPDLQYLDAVFVTFHRARRTYNPSQAFEPWLADIVRLAGGDAVRKTDGA